MTPLDKAQAEMVRLEMAHRKIVQELEVRRATAEALKAEWEMATQHMIHDAVKEALTTKTDLPKLGGIN